jgi:hypothetical protein
MQYKRIYNFYDEYVELANSIMKTVSPFFEGNVTLEQVVAAVTAIKENYEVKLKKQLGFLVAENMITSESKGDLLQKVESFNGKDYAYFMDNQFLNNELNELTDLVIKVAEALTAKKFDYYKAMLEKQLEVIR